MGDTGVPKPAPRTKKSIDLTDGRNYSDIVQSEYLINLRPAPPPPKPRRMPNQIPNHAEHDMITIENNEKSVPRLVFKNLLNK